MDEFMTLRRLNIRIQGFPESYATEPYMMAEDIVAGEPRHVTHDSLMAGVPPPPPHHHHLHPDATVTAIPHDSQVEVSVMHDSSVGPAPEELSPPPEAAPSPRPSPRASPNGSRPSSETREIGVGDAPVNGGGDEAPPEVADV